MEKSSGKTTPQKEGDDSNAGTEIENIDLKQLGKQIADVRRILDCTQVLFAKAIDIAPQTLSLIERGNFALTNNLAAKIYFSLYEVLADKETVELLGFQRYQRQCIDDLMTNLMAYILSMNLSLKATVDNNVRNEVDDND